MNTARKDSSGFTLIELLIVIVIIGLLSGLILSILNSEGLRGRARDGQRVSDLRKVQMALELYFSDNRCYPNSDQGASDCAGTGNWVRINGSTDDLSNSIEPNYLDVMPTDPQDTGGSANVKRSGPCGTCTTNRYNYRTDATGSWYVLTAVMEDTASNDGQECSGLSNWVAAWCAPFTCSDQCYGVQNP